MARVVLKDGGDTFEVTVHECTGAARVVLFAVGGGGDPERHHPLLRSLVDRGCTVVAPHFERLAAPRPSEEHLLLRRRRLRLALDAVAAPHTPVAGVGHSIGATVLLALAGGELWMRKGHRVEPEREPRIDRLALLAPATGYFKAAGALDEVRVPIVAWVGTEDSITPPAGGALLKRAVDERVPVEVRIVEGAGHFSFMHAPPPQMPEPLADRAAFLAQLSDQLGQFVTAARS